MLILLYTRSLETKEEVILICCVAFVIPYLRIPKFLYLKDIASRIWLYFIILV